MNRLAQEIPLLYSELALNFENFGYAFSPGKWRN